MVTSINATAKSWAMTSVQPAAATLPPCIVKVWPLQVVEMAPDIALIGPCLGLNPGLDKKPWASFHLAAECSCLLPILNG